MRKKGKNQMKKKIIIIGTILIIIFSNLIMQIIKNTSVKASDSDVYDIILFWGQSNMVSWANTEGEMPDGFKDIYNFSKETDIDADILERTKSTSLVNTPIEDDTAYIYKYLSNSFDEITSTTYILGDGFDKSDYRDGEIHGLTYNPSTGKLEKYAQGTSEHISIQTTENVNMIPEFCRTYYERTGHKVIAVTGAVGGATIESFLPKSNQNHKINDNTTYITDYMYEAIKENFNGAVNLANSKGYNISGKYWVCFQGEGNVEDEAPLDVSANKENYENYFTQVKNNLKNDLGTTLGAIVETSQLIGYDFDAIGVRQMHNSQENLINTNDDIILGSSYAYDHYVPGEETYNSDNFTTRKYLDYNGDKLEYSVAFEQAKKSVCYEQENGINFHSAALSQIGRDCANNIANALGYLNDLQEINYSSITDDNAYYNNLEIPGNMTAGDPFLIKEGDTYYLYATDNVYYTSTDLKNWEWKGKWITAPSDLNIQYYWAPEVYKYNNKFYMFFTGVFWGNGYPYGSNDGTNTSHGAVYLAETDNLSNGFTFVKKIDVGLDNVSVSDLQNVSDSQEELKANHSYIDGSLLFDEDRIYMYFKSEEKQDIWVIELDSDFNRKTEQPTRLITLDESIWERHINEGPFVIKKNDMYYLMYSAGEYTNDCYSVGYATSYSPMGPFTKKTIEKPLLYGSEPKYENDKYVFDSSKYIYGTGHNMVLKTSEDEMYIVYHSATFNKDIYETITGADQKYYEKTISQFTGIRKLNIDRIGIDSDGNLYVDGPSTVNHPLPSGTTKNGVTYNQLSKKNYQLSIQNSNEVSYLSDGINYLTKNVESKFATTKEIDIKLNQRKDVTDVWLYGNGSTLGFNNAVVDISINDKYIIKDVSLGNSTCFKINIPYDMENLKNEHIKTIKIVADKEIYVSEVNIVTTNSDAVYEDKYIVTFNSNWGNESDTNVIKDIGSTLGTLPIVTKTGYTFKGWYNSQTGGTQITPSTIVDGNVTYYAQWIPNDDTKYVVNHWQQNIGGIANNHDSDNYTKIESEDLEGETDTEVTPNIKTYEGFTSPSTQTVTIMPDGKAEVNYYYTRNQYEVTLDKDEGIDSVNGADTYYYDQDVTINAEVNENYIWVNWTGTDTLNDIESTFKMPAQDVELKANTIKKASVTTKYVDINTKEELTDAIVDNGYEGKEYTTTRKEFEGYEYVKVEGITEGNMTDNSIEVTYYYGKITKLEIYYFDKTNNETISDTKVIDGYVGKEYEVKPLQIDGYQYSDCSDNTSGIMTEETIKIYFSYLKESGINVKYVDINTNEEIAKSKHYDINSTEEYDATEDYQDIESYTYIKDSGNIKGIATNEGIDIIYYYAYNSSVIVRYIDINTNEEIADSELIEGYEGKEYSSEEKEIKGYQFTKVDNDKGNIERDQIKVNYYYTKEISIEIQYIDYDTNTYILESKIINGIEGEEYDITNEIKKIGGYQYINTNVELKGKFTLENTIIKLYYKMNDSVVENDKTENNNTADNIETENNAIDNNGTNNDQQRPTEQDDTVTVDNKKIDYSTVDHTTAKGIIPNTGKNIIVISIITSIILISLIFFIKYKKYKGI